MEPLGKNHFVRKVQADVSEICQPLFEKLDLHYFHFFRAHKDGSATVLYNRMDWHDYFYKMNFKTKVPLQKQQKRQIKLDQCYLSLWEGVVQDDVVRDAHIHFGLNSPLAINIVQKDYIDSFGFAGKNNDDSLVNKYFANIETLVNFTSDFFDKASGLISQAQASSFLLPKPNRPDEIKLLTNLTQALSIRGKYGLVKLTFKELESLKMLCGGLSAKEIAGKLNRSVRTIESHIDNMKRKLGCQKKSQLVALALKNGVRK